MDLLHWFTDPFQYPFMQRALIEVLVMGAVTGALGAYVVVRGLAFIGDALSHAVFPGIVIAFLLGQNFFAGGLIFGMLTSLGIGVVSRNRRISEDTAIGVIFAGAFALGVTLISSQRSYTRDLASFLFGNVLGVSNSDLITAIVLGALVVLAIIVLYKELLLNAFDPTMAAAMGYPTFLLDLLLLALITMTIIVALPAVGNILVLAMLVTPAGGTIVLMATAAFIVALLVSPRNGLVARFLRHDLSAAEPSEGGLSLVERPVESGERGSLG